jgi:hypothetical protein
MEPELPEQVAVTKAYDAFNPDGTLKDPEQQNAIEQIGAKVATMVAKLNA